jgi:hypothetical protein
MKSFVIFLRRSGLDLDRDVAIVKEGFSWPAFLFTALWALWCRLWIAAAIFIFAQCSIFLTFLVVRPDPLSQGILSIGLAVIFGCIGNDLRQRRLTEEGFKLCGIVKGKSEDHSYSQFLARAQMIISDLKI